MLGALLVLIVAAIAATSGVGDDGPSGDAVAKVDGEEITAEVADHARGQGKHDSVGAAAADEVGGVEAAERGVHGRNLHVVRPRADDVDDEGSAGHSEESRSALDEHFGT